MKLTSSTLNIEITKGGKKYQKGFYPQLIPSKV